MYRNSSDFLDRARRTGTPIVAIRTYDARATIDRCKSVFMSKTGDPVWVWNCLDGIYPINKVATEWYRSQTAGPDRLDLNGTNVLAKAMKSMQSLPENSMIFVIHAQRHFDNHHYITGISELRQPFKGSKRCLILLMTSSVDIISEISGDIVKYEEELPSDDVLLVMVERIFASVRSKYEFANVDNDDINNIISALRGMCLSKAEQVLSNSLVNTGQEKNGRDIIRLDMEILWDAKRTEVDNTPGLQFFYRQGPTLDDVGGNEGAKRWINAYKDGPERPTAIVWIDEAEKMMSGSNHGGDSGVGARQHMKMLGWMDDGGDKGKVRGALCIGVAGSGKSMIARAAGNHFDVPVIKMNTGEMMQGTVGSTEANTARALDMINSIGGDRILCIATCNGIESLSPELRSRFGLVQFFFDIPTDIERDSIWKARLTSHNMDVGVERPNDNNWTGRDINTCIVASKTLGMTLVEAAAFSVTPLADSDPETIEGLRRLAHMRFISAAKAGRYSRPETKIEAKEYNSELNTDTTRNMSL